MEKTLILVKPDAFARGLSGEIIARFERKGLKIIAAKHMVVSEDLAKQHYAEHTERPFFGELVSLHHLRPDHRARLRGRRRDQGRPPGDRRHQPARGDDGLDPRRLRDRGRHQHGPRLGLARVRHPRGGAVLPRALTLASASPQRRAILEQVGITFDVRVSGVEEETHGDPVAVAEENARRKALAVPSRSSRSARTRWWRSTATSSASRPTRTRRASTSRAWPGAPTRSSARSPSSATASSTHTATEITQVHFRDASPALLDWYVGTGEWRGRAGGYAIQGAGAVLVAGIEGDYLNVVGLPLQRLIDLVPELLPG